MDVNDHDFMDKDLGKAIPYGIYDPTDNAGWVTVGTDHDTAEFAVESIRQWWYHMGRDRYPDARGLLITEDGGGSNSSRSRLWKAEIQRLADELGIPSPSATFLPARPNEMPLSIACFPPSASIGEVGP